MKKPTVDVSLVDDNENCISFDIEGGMRGKIWIDAETHDVLRLDRSLTGLIEIPLPRKVTRARRQPALDDGAVGFVDSLQAGDVRGSAGDAGAAGSSSTLQVTRGAGTPRLRTTTQYPSYRRFITGARVVPPQ